jgi:hypothetical protein
MPCKGQRINGLILSLDLFEAGSRWLRDLLLYSRVGLRCPCGTVIVIVVQIGKIEIEASLWYPYAVLVMPVIDMPYDNRCRHRGARCCGSLSLCPLLYSSSSCLALCLVICSGGRSLHRLVSSCIVVYRVYRRAHRRIRSRCHWKLEGGYLVDGSNVGIHVGGGGDKGADSLWIPGLTTVEAVIRILKHPQPTNQNTHKELGIRGI